MTPKNIDPLEADLKEKLAAIEHQRWADWSKHANKWRASINLDGRKKNLGYFERIEDAAKKYKETAEAHFGEFAYTD